MRLEGIVSKRRSSPYRSGRSPHWLKAKNRESLAARREAKRLRTAQETPMSERIITVRDWRRRPPLRLHMHRIKCLASPAAKRIEDGTF